MAQFLKRPLRAMIPFSKKEIKYFHTKAALARLSRAEYGRRRMLDIPIAELSRDPMPPYIMEEDPDRTIRFLVRLSSKEMLQARKMARRNDLSFMEFGRRKILEVPVSQQEIQHTSS